MTDEEIKDFGPELLKQEFYDFRSLIVDTLFRSKGGFCYSFIVEKNVPGIYCWVMKRNPDSWCNGHYLHFSGEWNDLKYYFKDLPSLKAKLHQLYGVKEEEW